MLQITTALGLRALLFVDLKLVAQMAPSRPPKGRRQTQRATPIDSAGSARQRAWSAQREAATAGVMAELMRGGRPKMRMSTNSATHGGIDHRDRGSYRSRRPPTESA